MMSDLCGLRYISQRLGVPQSWVREQADEGVIPCLRIHRKYLFNIEAVAESLAVLAAKSQAAARPAVAGVDAEDTVAAAGRPGRN